MAGQIGFRNDEGSAVTLASLRGPAQRDLVADEHDDRCSVRVLGTHPVTTTARTCAERVTSRWPP
jgi:hypothetical protein